MSDPEKIAGRLWGLGIYELLGQGSDELFAFIEGIYPGFGSQFYGIYSNLAFNTDYGT